MNLLSGEVISSIWLENSVFIFAFGFAWGRSWELNLALANQTRANVRW